MADKISAARNETARARHRPSRFPVGVGGQLTWLELKRVARGWRWRALVIVAAFGAFWWRRDGFGPGRPVFFPLGEDGLIGFSALFGVASILLGVDAIGQVQRGRAARLFDTRPLPDIVLAAARWVASFVLVCLAAAGFLAEVVGLSRALEQPCAVDPLAAWWLLWWMPGIAVACATGFALRSWIRNDAAAILSSVALLAAGGWLAWRILSPGAIYARYAPHLGLILPWNLALADAGRMLLLALAGVALAAVGQRRWFPRTPVRPKPPYPHRPFPTLRRLLAPVRQWRFTDRLTAILAVGALAAGIAVAPPWVAEWRFLQIDPEAWSDLAAPLPPELTRSPVPAWKILRLDADLGDSANAHPRFTLVAGNTTTATLEWGSLALSTAWDGVELTGGGGDIRPGPVDGTWVFAWRPPLDPGTTATLNLTAAPRAGSARLHAQVWNPRYMEWARLGAWWPRPNGFALLDRRVTIPGQPFDFQITLAKSGSGRPAGSSARVEDLGDRWRLVSTFPQSRIFPILADFMTVERSFEGLEVRLEVFPQHEELANFLLDLYEGRFERLRRALGVPAAPFVFHEAAVAPAFPDPFSLASADLDALVDAIPGVDAEDENTYEQFNEAFIPWQKGMIDTWIAGAVGAPAEPLLLRDSLASYIHTIAFNQGLRRSPRELRERAGAAVPFVPWLGRPTGPLPYDFREADLPALRGSWDESKGREQSHGEIDRRRAECAHHLLRYLLGETEYASFLRQLLSRSGRDALTREEFLSLAQSRSTTPLAPVIDQILGPPRLPTFQARGARVYLDRNPQTRVLEYTTEVTVANVGDGRWPVPLLLTTEDDQLERRVELGPGESAALRLVTRGRPTGFFVDPVGWIPQVPEYDPVAKSIQHPRIYIKQVESRVKN